MDVGIVARHAIYDLPLVWPFFHMIKNIIRKVIKVLFGSMWHLKPSFYM